MNKQILILVFIFMNFNCVQNKIFIKEVYIGTEKLSAEDKKNLTFKEVKVCNKINSVLMGGEAPIRDQYDKKIPEVLSKTFAISNNSSWYDVELYNDDNDSCKVLKGYYHAKK